MSDLEFLKAKREIYDLVIEEVANSAKNLKELEHWRTVEFPQVMRQRYEKETELYINKEELKKLVEWKMKKGKFRPMLKKLINQNEEQDVVMITKYGFKVLLDVKETKPDKDEYKKLIRESLNTLTTLRGVGPATASLLLSLLNKITKLAPPFYSDEAAEYIFQVLGGADQIKLRYSLPEYIKWLDLFWDVNKEYKHDFTDLENGVWAIKLNEYYQLKPTVDSNNGLNQQEEEEAVKEEQKISPGNVKKNIDLGKDKVDEKVVKNDPVVKHERAENQKVKKDLDNNDDQEEESKPLKKRKTRSSAKK